MTKIFKMLNGLDRTNIYLPDPEIMGGRIVFEM